MPASCRIASLIPSGLIVESETRGDDEICLVVRAAARAWWSVRSAPRRPGASIAATCDVSRTCRARAGLVRLHIVTRRFCCEASDCPRRIFAERFDEAVLPVRSRRTARLEGLVHHLGSGARRPACRVLRQAADAACQQRHAVARRDGGGRRSGVGALNVIGIDDWAFRRHHRYGTIVCDLERRRVVALLPDRERATIEAWLGDHPEIQIVSRDRGGGYGEAAAKGIAPCPPGRRSLAPLRERQRRVP